MTGTPHCPLSKAVVKKHIALLQTDRSYQSGLRPLAEQSDAYMARYGQRAPGSLAFAATNRLDPKEVAKLRVKQKTCDEIHHGLCKFYDSEDLSKAKRLPK